jgi:hypothetical protein
VNIPFNMYSTLKIKIQPPVYIYYHTIFVAGVVSDQDKTTRTKYTWCTILEALVNKMNRVSVLDVFIRSSITGITRANEEKKMYAIGKVSHRTHNHTARP